METVYLDFETTGLGKEAEILEATIIDDTGKPVINTLVKPQRHERWIEAQRVHGISPLDVRNAPKLNEIKNEILNAVRNKRLVIFNSAYDLQYLPEMEEVASEVRCCMKEMAKHVKTSNGRISLSNSVKIIGYEWEGTAHRALADCLSTRAVWNFVQKNKK